MRFRATLQRFSKYPFFSKKAFILLSLIILLGAFLRLFRIEDYLTFLGDEGRDVLVAKDILAGHFTLLGPRASAGDFFLGPIYYYLIAPFLFLANYNPVGPAVMVAFFGIATIFLVFKVGKSFFDTKSGLFAASLYAVSPLVIAYSRSSWNPNIMPFFSILTLLFAYKGVSTTKARYWALSGFFLGVSMQLHYLSIFIGAIIFFFVMFDALFQRFSKDIKTKTVIFGLIKSYALIFFSFLAGLSPFLLFELRHGFPNTKTILGFIFQSGSVSGSSNSTEIISSVFFKIFSRLLANFPPPEQVYKFSKITIQFWQIGVLALAFFAVVLLVSQLYKNFVKGNRDKFLQHLLLVTWLVFGIFLFGFYKKPIYDYYFGFMFPLPFLLVGNLLGWLYERRFIFKALSLLIFISLFYINIQANPFRYEPNKQYKQVKTAAEFILKQTNNKPFNFALISGGNSDHAYRYIFEVNGRPPVTIENLQVDPKRTTVMDQLFVICEENPCYPLGHSLWEISGFGRGEIVDSWDVSVLKIYKLERFKE